jgi:hypothetical protein
MIQYLEASLVRDLVIVFQQIDEYKRAKKDSDGKDAAPTPKTDED